VGAQIRLDHGGAAAFHVRRPEPEDLVVLLLVLVAVQVVGGNRVQVAHEDHADVHVRGDHEEIVPAGVPFLAGDGKAAPLQVAGEGGQNLLLLARGAVDIDENPGELVFRRRGRWTV
jgi:hypothetical protein